MPPKYPVVVPGVGPVPALGMIVGEAPGRNEIEQGIPFCGRSGDLLDDALRSGASSRAEFYITNVYKGDVGSGNPNPTQEQIQDHWPLLRREIADVAPRGILLLGRVATEAFFHEVGRMADAIAQQAVAEGVRCFPCWHPSYVLRGGGHGVRAVEFYETIGRFIEYIRD